METMGWPRVLAVIFGLLLGAALGGVALHDLVTNGPFSWHISQPRYLQGLVEIAVLACISALAFRFTRFGVFIAAASVALYARRHAIDYAFLVSGVYVLGIFFLGTCIRKLLPPPQTGVTGANTWNVIEAVVIGTVAFSAFQWLLGGMGAGYELFIWMSWAACAAAIVAAAIVIKPSTRVVSSIVYFQSTTLLAPAVVVSLIFLGLAAIAKTNFGFDSDSVWYGMRPDRVLFAENGVFDSAGLTAQVHYYPKTYELLVTPLSNTGDNSTIPALGVWAWGFLTLAAAALFRRLDLRGLAFWSGIFAIGTLPAALNVAATAKGDVLAAAFTVVGAASIVWSARSADMRYVSTGAAALFLAPFIRLSVLPYAGILGLVLVATALFTYGRQRSAAEGTWRWLIIPTVALVGCLAAMYRTYNLSGVPFVAPGELQRLFLALGASLQFPVGAATNWSHVPIPPFWPLLQDFLFQPNSLPHVRIYWTGNVWAALLFLGAVAPFLPSRQKPLERVQRLGVAAAICTSALFFAFLATKHFGVRGGDGNYYIVPITLLLVSTIVLARRFGPLTAGLCIGGGIVHALIFFMSSLWQTGTRTLDLDLYRNPIDDSRFVSSKLNSAGLGTLHRALGACDASTLVFGILPRPQGYLLPIRYEPIQEIGWANKEFVLTSDSFSRYLRATRADIVVLPVNGTGSGAGSKTAANPRLLRVARDGTVGALKNQRPPVRIGLHDAYAVSPAGAICLNTGLDQVQTAALPREMLLRDGSTELRLLVERQSCSEAASASTVSWRSQSPETTFHIYVKGSDGGEKLFASVRGQGNRSAKWIRAGTTFVIRNASRRQLGTYIVADAVCL